jgi:hypothetical protein
VADVSLSSCKRSHSSWKQWLSPVVAAPDRQAPAFLIGIWAFGVVGLGLLTPEITHTTASSLHRLLHTHRN